MRYRNLDSLVLNQSVMITAARASHRIIPIREASSISLAILREWVSLSLVIHVDCEIFPAVEFISFILSEPPTSSWQACARTSMGLTLDEKRRRVDLCPSPAEKEGKLGLSLELLDACAVPIHIFHDLICIDNNELEKNDRPIFFAPPSVFCKHLGSEVLRLFMKEIQVTQQGLRMCRARRRHSWS